MLMLTDTCLERFEKFIYNYEVDESIVFPCSCGINNTPDISYLNQYFPISFRFGIYQEFFDEEGYSLEMFKASILEESFFRVYIKKGSEVIYNNAKEENESQSIKTREQAMMKLIETINTIYNSTND